MLVMLALSACNPGSYSSPYGGLVTVQGVKVTPQVVQLNVGQTRLLVATLAPTNATDQVVAWESSDTTIASVSAAGVVAAKAPGAGVFVTAFTHDGGFQASVNVSVNP
jgi:uncharacterized protein YjdB